MRWNIIYLWADWVRTATPHSGDSFYESENFQQVLSHLYSDILDFHSHAYRLVLKPGMCEIQRSFDLTPC